MEDEKRLSKSLLGKTVVSETGKIFGDVGDLGFETSSGEIMHVVLSNPATHALKLDLEKDKSGNILIPFTAVLAIADYLVIREEDII